VNDSGDPDTVEGGWVGGPLRRWRRSTPRERTVRLVVQLLACAFGGVVFGLLGTLMHDGTGVSGAVFFGAFMFLVYLYEPELRQLVRRMDQ
jgi:hypothetical protein